MQQTTQMTANKMTAVEWLLNTLITENEITLKGENYKLFDMAMRMEKEQIVNAWDDGDYSYYYSKEMGNTFENGEEYYKANYGK